MAVTSFTYTTGFDASPFTPVDGMSFHAYPVLYGSGDMGPFRIDSGTPPPGLEFDTGTGHITGILDGHLRRKELVVAVSNGGVWYPTTIVFLGEWVNHRSVVSINEREDNA